MVRDLTNVKVAVTGAGGLVGGHVVRRLVESGLDVTAVVRSSGKEELARYARSVREKGKIEVRIADVRDERAARRAIEGTEVVIHAAGTVDMSQGRQSVFDTNVGGTKAVLAAAKECGVKQFIFISSLSVITGQGDQYDLDESAPLKPCGEAYADSKIEAERLVMQEARGDKIAVTSLRPGFIYGPGETAWMPRLIANISNGKAMLIDGGAKETNVIYIENLCRAVLLAILNDKTYGQVYNLTDGQKISKKELFDAISEGLSLPLVTKKISSKVAKPACEMISIITPLLPQSMRQNLSRFSKAAYRLAGVNQGFNISKAERELNYVDRIPFSEGMARTLATIRENR